MKKKILLIAVLICSFAVSAVAQNRTHISLMTGVKQYRYSPEARFPGWGVGLEIKHAFFPYTYVVSDFFYGLQTKSTLPTRELEVGDPRGSYDLKSQHDVTLTLGLGANLLNEIKHKIYLQGLIGFGQTIWDSDNIDLLDKEYNVSHKQTGFVIVPSIGYDYYVHPGLAVGLAYNGIYMSRIYHHMGLIKITYAY